MHKPSSEQSQLPFAAREPRLGRSILGQAALPWGLQGLPEGGGGEGWPLQTLAISGTLQKREEAKWLHNPRRLGVPKLGDEAGQVVLPWAQGAPGGQAIAKGPGGLFGALASPGRPPHPPHQKIFPPAKNEIYQRGRKFEADFRHTNFVLASDPPPPPLWGVGGGCP